MIVNKGHTPSTRPFSHVKKIKLKKERDDEKKLLISIVNFPENFRGTKMSNFSTVVELDPATVVPSCSGPKRPHDRVAVTDMKSDFIACLNNPAGFKGFGIASDKISTTVPFVLDGQEYTLNHGSVLIAAITSCTNTSNPR